VVERASGVLWGLWKGFAIALETEELCRLCDAV